MEAKDPKNTLPPKWMDRLLERFCASHLVEEVMGDLHERYFMRIQKFGEREARTYYLREVLSFIRPYVFKKQENNNPKTLRIAMIKNYFKIAYRNLLKQKVYSGINITGLSIGMACCIIIFQYVTFETSFDHFHDNKSHIYRILQGGARGNDELDFRGAYTAQALAPALKERVPEILHITRLHADDIIVSNAEKPEQVFEEDEVLYADPDFLQMFSFSIVDGDKQRALEPGTGLISKEAAKKYFGDVNPIGQVLDVTGRVSKSFRVVGVFEDVPTNSHLQFEILLSMDDLLKSEAYVNEPEGGWSWNNFSTYVQLHPSANPIETDQKLTKVYLDYRGEILKQQGFKSALHLQPLADIHLNAEVTGSSNEVIGDARTVYFFTIIGLVTLFIALVNYINLSTARALNRAREVGIRKVIGAQRMQLVWQFLCESALTNFAAVILAIVLANSLIPVVNGLAETQLSLSLWMSPEFWLALLLILVVGTMLAGLYPAFVLSSFKPITVLKGKTSSFSAQRWLRKGLVVLQFTASIVLVIGTVIIYKQLNYMRGMDLGLNLEQVLTVEGPRVLPEESNGTTATTAFLQELRRLPAVQQAAVSSSLPGKGFNWNGAAIRKSTDDPANAIRGVATYIDTAFAKLYGLELVAGKGFGDITMSSAEDAPWAVIANEKTINSLGFISPAEAIDQRLDIGGYEAQIVGVYKNFNWSSAHSEQQNIVFGPTSQGRNISLRLSTPDLQGTISEVKAIYNQLFPGNVFNYQFIDEVFDQQYKNDIRFAKLFSLFAGLAIFIACLGLFALAAFTAQQRQKEIGIRKILGATVENVVTLLSADFLKLIVIGFVVAAPVAWYVMNQWLEEFVYKVEIGVGVFVIAGLAAGLLGLATVSWQSLKAAIANPVDSLRDE